MTGSLGIDLLGVGVGRLGVGDVGDICKGRPSGNPGICPEAGISESSIPITAGKINANFISLS
jgi:hypothetical protein